MPNSCCSAISTNERARTVRLFLQSVSDDIAYIESQNRGLQVQTANQRALLTSIEQLIVCPVLTHDQRSSLFVTELPTHSQQIVQVNPDELRALTQESLETEKGISSLERALSSLYKALLVGRGQFNVQLMIRLVLSSQLHQVVAIWLPLLNGRKNTRHTTGNFVPV